MERKVKTKIQLVVEHYKQEKGFLIDDKVWDKIYFPRFVRSAKILLELCGDSVEAACLQIDDTRNYCEGKNLSWTLDTVIKLFPELQKKKEKERMAKEQWKEELERYSQEREKVEQMRKAREEKIDKDGVAFEIDGETKKIIERLAKNKRLNISDEK